MTTLEPVAFVAAVEPLGEGEILVRQELQYGLAGVDRAGYPTAIFPVSDDVRPGERSSGQLRMSLERRVEIRRADSTEVLPAVCLRCLDGAVLPTFCTLVDAIDREIASGRDASSARVIEVVREWERLFRSRRRLGPEEELGLWGELSFILSGSGVDALVLAWRGPDPARLDFVAPHVAFEVKTSLGGHTHRTSLDQIRAADSHPVAFVASLWVAETPDGRALPDLVEEVRAATGARDEFERKLIRAGFADVDARRYDRRLQLVGDPMYVAWDRLPRVRSFDPGARDIRYTFELDPDDATDPDSVPRIGP